MDISWYTAAFSLCSGFLVTVAGFYQQYRSQKTKAEVPSSPFVPKFSWPKTSNTEIVNAAGLASFALCAYYRNTTPLVEWCERNGVTVELWSNADTQGFVAYRDDDIVIGVAGTSQLQHWRTNLDIVPISMEEFCQSHDLVLLDPDAVLHAGFAGHADLCLRAVSRIVDLNAFKNVWWTGHSLGGATAHLAASLTIKMPRGVFTYGAPKPYHWRSKENSVPVVRVFRLFDIVPLVPGICFRHSKSETICIRYTGNVRSKRTVTAWFAGVIRYGCALVSGNCSSVVQEHGMEWYCRSLEPFVE